MQRDHGCRARQLRCHIYPQACWLKASRRSQTKPDRSGERGSWGRLDLTGHWPQTADKHDAHVAELPAAIAEQSGPLGLASCQVLPNLHAMIARRAFGQQKGRHVLRHEIPRPWDDNRVALVSQHMNEMT